MYGGGMDMEERRSIKVTKIIVEVNSVVSDEKTRKIEISRVNNGMMVNSNYRVFTALIEEEHARLKLEAVKLFERNFSFW